MKPTIIVSIYTFVATISYGQSKIEILNDNKDKYALICELISKDTLQQHDIDYTCEDTSEKGTLTYYYNSRELKHILHEYKQDLIQYKDEYYIWDDQLFFGISVKKIEEHAIEERFHFYNSNPISCQYKNFETQNNRVLNESNDCKNASNIIERYDLLVNYQYSDTKGNCIFPKGVLRILKKNTIQGDLDVP